MATSDPIADMLTRIRNSVRVGKTRLHAKRSKVLPGRGAGFERRRLYRRFRFDR